MTFVIVMNERHVQELGACEVSFVLIQGKPLTHLVINLGIIKGTAHFGELPLGPEFVISLIFNNNLQNFEEKMFDNLSLSLSLTPSNFFSLSLSIFLSLSLFNSPSRSLTFLNLFSLYLLFSLSLEHSKYVNNFLQESLSQNRAVITLGVRIFLCFITH